LRFTRNAVATIVVALATAACGSVSDRGVRITIGATQPEIVQGEVAQVVVTVLNTGEHPITMQGNTCKRIARPSRLLERDRAVRR